MTTIMPLSEGSTMISQAKRELNDKQQQQNSRQTRQRAEWRPSATAIDWIAQMRTLLAFVQSHNTRRARRCKPIAVEARNAGQPSARAAEAKL